MIEHRNDCALNFGAPCDCLPAATRERQRQAPRVYAAVVVFVTLVAVGLLNVWYTDRVDRQAERRNVQRSREICGIIRLIDDRQQAMPPATDPDTADFRAELHRYRLALGC